MPTKPPIPPVHTRSTAPHVAQALARTLPSLPVSPAPAPRLPAAPVQAKPQPGAGPRPPAPHVQAALATSAALAASATLATSATSTTLAGTAQAMPDRRFPAAVRPPAPHVQTAVAQPKLRPSPPGVPRASTVPPALPARTAPVLPSTAVRTPPARPASPLAPPPVVQPSTFARPKNFTTASKQSAYLSHNLLSDYQFVVADFKTARLNDYNGAMPHRMSFKNIRDSIKLFADGEEDEDDLRRWTDRFLKAGKEKMAETEKMIGETRRDLRQARRDYEKVKKKIEAKKDDRDEARKTKDKSLEKKLRQELEEEEKRKRRRHERISRLEEEKEGLELLLEKQSQSQEDFLEARRFLIDDPNAKTLRKFVIQANSFHANVPNLGPHFGVNQPVGEQAHLNLRESRSRKRRRSPSPMSRQVLDMSPERISRIAVDEDDKIITTSGEAVKTKYLDKEIRKRIKKRGTKRINSFDPNFKKFK